MRESDPRPGSDGFPATRQSVVAGLCNDDPRLRRDALDAFAGDYRPSLHGYLRRRHPQPPEVIEDLLQSFFVNLQERDALAQFDPERGRFRAYLRVLLDRWVVDAHRREQRAKRGGGATHAPIEDVDATLAAPAVDPDQVFREEWVRQLFHLALKDLQRDAEENGRTTQWQVFERYDIRPESEGERPTYADLAEELGVPTTKITNDLHAARRRFRGVLLGRLREVCRDDAEWRDEARELLGIEVG